MNRDEIIRMALKCGAKIKSDCEGNGAFGDGIDLIEFASLVAAAEREACAKVCEQWGAWNNVAQDCAAAIRSRGQK